MTITEIINRLEINRNVFKALLANKPEEEYRWCPSSNKWCFLEIVCHLIDEEREDFRARVKHTLEASQLEMPSIDPEGWVLQRDYKAQNYNEKVLEFLKERDHSILWLKTKINANWENAYMHPKRGAMSAKLFLTNWLAHDYLHIRQLNKYHYAYLKENTLIDLGYAGNW